MCFAVYWSVRMKVSHEVLPFDNLADGKIFIQPASSEPKVFKNFQSADNELNSAD
ncbi:Uncharacterized protein dnm_091200 [Desulfonema magnum]|uniref:Uncharacterized protein n=1 Tax=Desulfonema magnum TaxID=45655 RepID=A0A975BXK1_9BACT|nr:Uncharacterized protein dnm_091200 [Desulfonema magnum]